MAWQEQYLLGGSGLRFRRVKADGKKIYTVYGFNREPLSTFEVAAPGGAKAVKVFHSLSTPSPIPRRRSFWQFWRTKRVRTAENEVGWATRR